MRFISSLALGRDGLEHHAKKLERSAYTIVTSRTVHAMLLIIVAKRACLNCAMPINVGEEALECTGCRRVVYCSARCQRQDRSHGDICVQLQQLNAEEKQSTPATGRRTYDEYVTVVSALTNPVSNALKAYFGLSYEGHTMVGDFVKHGIKCEGCYLTPFQKPEDVEFTPCPRCELAWWCSPACKVDFDRIHTSEQCNVLYDIFCTERMKLDYGNARNTNRCINVNTDPSLHKTYIPISSISNWNEYFRTFDLKIALTTMKLAKELGAHNKNAQNAVVLLVKQAHVIPLTIATALEHAYPDMPKRTSICLHLVGADTFELTNMAMFENVLHYFPRLRTLKVCFIGPGSAVDTQYNSKNNACAACQRAGRVREMALHRSDYHDCPWSKPGNSYAPDLIVGFNTGMSEVAVFAWEKTLDLILKLGVPALFTAYSKGEVDQEEKMLRDRGRSLSRIGKSAAAADVRSPLYPHAEIAACFSSPLYRAREIIICTMADLLAAAREHNTLAPIHAHLANEHLQDIFLALSLIDTPSLERPQGWFLSVNGVCKLWREIALNSAELWARCAGSFPSQRMTDLAIQRAGNALLSFIGHHEDHEGQGYALTDYQLLLVETHAKRLRSLVHDDYIDWSGMFYRVRSFPELVTARIWDDSGPDMWNGHIDAPRMECLYLNNALIPFVAPRLRYLRVDMDNVDWRRRPHVAQSPGGTVPDTCAAVPRIFPTREFISLLQRCPVLERLIVTDMPLLMAKELPMVSELHAQLPNLRGLHLGGKSEALGDFWQRLEMPLDVQIFIDTEYLEDMPYGWRSYDQDALQVKITDHLNSPVYDSLRLKMTLSYDLVLQLWSSETQHASSLEIDTSLEIVHESTAGPAFTLRLPVGSQEYLENPFDYDDRGPNIWTGPGIDLDPFVHFQNAMARDFYRRTGLAIQLMESSTLKDFDLTDIPYAEYETLNLYEPDDCLFVLSRHDGPDRSVTLRWSLICRILEQAASLGMQEEGIERLEKLYLGNFAKITIVDFPCATFPSPKRCDEELNAKAWDTLTLYFRDRKPENFLVLSESPSELSNMERSEDTGSARADPESYTDAVRAVTREGCRRIAPFVTGFEDLRVHNPRS
ncbi:unnamed protein product [Peniophora sp. CBMAI 1063]|nr:unnamed protein product [Peniophora sp. CBMAI 1063]